MIRPEHPFDIRPDLRKAASTKAASVIRPNQLVRKCMDFTANTGIVSSHSIHHQRHHDLSVGLNFCNTTVVAPGAGYAYPCRAPEFTPGFSGVHVAQCLIFYAMFC